MTKEEAKQIARKECAARGWPWEEPVHVIWGLFHYEVWTNAHSRGGNVIIRIRRKTGAIASACMTPWGGIP